MKVGYLIPEFPGQTHIFFWRERTALEKLGVGTDLLSTRRPPASLVCHRWSREAMAATTYLSPMGVGAAAGCLGTILGAGPRGWARCLGAIAGAGEEGLKGRARMLGLLMAGARVARLARRRGWSHVHVHSCANSAYIAMFAHMLRGVSYSLTLHGPLGDYGRGQRDKWGHAAFGVVITDVLMREVRERLPGVDPGRLEIAPMGVDTGVFRRSAAYEPYRGEGPLRLFSCGRLNPVKGHDDLLRAAALLRDGGMDVEVRIAGEGSHRGALGALIRELGLEGRARLLGAMPEEEVRGEVERSHIFVLASLHEPLGVAIMEAMAMEAPVVVTRGGGVHELVEDGVSGVMAPVRDPAALAAAVRRVAMDPGLAARLGAAGRRRVVERFSSAVSAGVIARRLRGLGAGGGVREVEGAAGAAAPVREVHA